MNSFVLLSQMGKIPVITLSRPPANAINTDLLIQLLSILENIPEEQPFIITGLGSIFSAGFDLFLVSVMNKPEFSDFIDLFQEVLKKIKFHSSPTATVLNGHAVAGGFIIACAADYRFSTNSDCRFGLNEKILGFTLPPVPQAIVEVKLKGHTEKVLNSKNLLTMKELKEIPFFIECSDNPLELAGKKLDQSLIDKRILRNKKYDRKWVKKFLENNESMLRKEFETGWWSEKSKAARKKQLELFKLKNEK